MPKTQFTRKIQTGFWLVGAILLLIGFAAYQSIRELQKNVDWVADSQEVLRGLQAVLSDVQDIEIGLRGFIMTGKEHFLEPYKSGLDMLVRHRKELSTIILPNPEDHERQSRNHETLEILIDDKLALLKIMLALRKEKSYRSSQMESYIAKSKSLMDSIRTLIETMQMHERVRLSMRQRHADEKGKIAIRNFAVGLTIEIIILVWMAWQIRREIIKRHQAQEALRHIRDDLESRVLERTKALVDSNERLRELSHRLMNVQETERRQIAHDLHDEIGQSLTAMKLDLREANSALDSGVAAFRLTDSLNILDQVIWHVRNLALDLRPSMLDELGLVPALRWYIKRHGERAKWKIEYFAAEGDIHLSSDIEITCFRIAQEALTNIARYAEATQVRVTLERQGEHLLLTIEDDGKGFDVVEAKTRGRTGLSIGILGMEERARLIGGTITIISSPMTGTRVTASLPFIGLKEQAVASERLA